MAIVHGPFMSLFASGTFGKTITVSALYDGNKFIMGKHKSRSGKRHQIQIDNAQIFKERMQAVKETMEVI